ncbi:MAG TPA: hypothetical protein VFT51_03850 [Bacillales bacterium]|nr:hypothetical protein [Bacillales bacterium]
MKGILKSRKWRAIGFFILAFIVFGGLLMYRNLDQELTLPSENWSRDIELPVTISGEHNETFVREDGGRYHIYTHGKDGINQVVIDSKLNVLEQSSLSVDIPKSAPFWVRDHAVLTIKDHKLILYKNGEKQTLADSVEGIVVDENSVVVWKGKQLYTVDLKSFTLQSAGKLDTNIHNVILEEKADSFLAITKTESTPAKFHLIQKQGGNSFKQTYEFSLSGTQFSESDTHFAGFNHALSGFDYVYRDHVLSIYFSSFGMTHFGLQRKNYLATIPVHQVGENATLEKLTLIGKGKQKLQNAKGFQVTFQQGKPVLLFSSSGYMPYIGTATNVYRAEKQGEKWLAINVSGTRKPSEDPVWLNDHTVLWYDMNSLEQQFLKGASQNPQVISRSLQLDGHDWTFAAGDTLFSMSKSLLLLVYTLFCLVPLGLFLLIMHVVNINLMERNPRWVKLVSMGLFLVSELYLIQAFLGDSLGGSVPEYLSFAGSLYVIPIALAVLSWFITNLVKGKEWENMTQIFYFIGIDVWMLMLLVGPYLI